MFPELFIRILILGALTLTSVAIVALLGLLVRDLLEGRLW
jgi:hypothetical protein